MKATIAVVEDDPGVADLQDGKIKVTSNDVIANMPFAEGCGLWFDHHSSEKERTRLEGHYEGRSAPAPSATGTRMRKIENRLSSASTEK